MKLTKTQLREIIKEVINETSNENAEAFQQYLLNKYKNKPVMGYKISYDHMSGATAWWAGKGKVEILATPFWQDDDILPVEVSNYDGDEVYNKKFPFKWDSDYKKMEQRYFLIMNKIFKQFKNK